MNLLTYNVWIGDPDDWDSYKKREPALLDIIAESNADVIGLQEVTSQFLCALHDDPRFKNYSCSEPDDAYLFRFNYGVIMLSRFPLAKSITYKLPTGMGRDLIVTVFEYEQTKIAVGTVHLESLKISATVRRRQLNRIFEILSDYEHAVLMGDFNICSTQLENNILPKAYTDVWPTLHGADPGWTLDNARNPLLFTSTYPSARFDRVLLRSDQLRPVEIDLVGTEPISNALCPSDHFGLQVALSVSPR